MGYQQVVSGAAGEVRGAGASKGVALTTTAAFTALPLGTNYVTLMPRNAATAVVVRYALNPWLIIVKTTDAFAAVGNATDYSEEAQDGSTATLVTLSSLSTAANDDYLYVGAHVPFRGVDIDVNATNGNASVLTVKYRKNDNTWADITATDGTTSGGATLAQDGTVTWTVPTDWLSASLRSIGADGFNPNVALYWTRWEVSAALDASVTLSHMLALNRSTTYAEFPTSLGKEFFIKQGVGGTGCIEALTDAGTANLVIEAATLNTETKFR